MSLPTNLPLRMTADGYEERARELEALRTEARRALAERLRHARDDGDLADNPGLQDLLEDQALLERRIAVLDAQLTAAEIVAPAHDGRAGIGSIVHVREETGETVEYELVGQLEADAGRRRVSIDAPIGSALAGLRAGERTNVETPGGPLALEVLAVRPELGPRADSACREPRNAGRQTSKGGDMRRSIVCGVDSSTDSQAAVAVAAHLADGLGARLVLAHVGEPVLTPYAYAAPFGGLSMSGPLVAEEQRIDLEESALRLLEEVSEAAGVDGEHRVAVGVPAERLAEIADDEGAELIVVGSRGRGAMKAAFLGSVSSSLVGVARCPVLIVPPGAAHA